MSNVRSDSCSGCPLCGADWVHKVVQTEIGPRYTAGGVLLIGEAPGGTENIEGRPFVGMAGKLLDHVLWNLGHHRNQIAIANVICCRPSRTNELPDAKQTRDILMHCKAHWQGDIKALKPGVIVVLGNTALTAVTEKVGISKWERIMWPDGQRHIVAAFHPAAVLRSPNLECKLACALESAFIQAHTPLNHEVKDRQVFPYKVVSYE